MRTEGLGVLETVPQHVARCRGLGLDDNIGGPFEDRTGGLITFRAKADSWAEQAVATDPFVERGLLEAYWLKRWTPE